jgi:polysaccharide biosynthesis protein PslH
MNDSRIVLHESPPDLSPLYASAALAVAPIRSGGGTRIKILEALAAGRAMICTEFAAEGLELRDGTDLEFANSDEDIAARISELIDDPARRSVLGSSGRLNVAQRFDWSRIESDLALLVERLLSS